MSDARIPTTLTEWAVRYPDGRVTVMDPPTGSLAKARALDLVGWHPNRRLLTREVTEWEAVTDTPTDVLCSSCHQPMDTPGCCTSPESKAKHPQGFHTISDGLPGREADTPTAGACDRGPCHLPRGHEGRCNPGGDALPRERYDAVLDSGPTEGGAR
ncbi:MAG: hypothetical protein JJE50_01635 [Actinomycetales bacterium]|nr:hypothetical protein [Actinomycetales bacterium]